MGSPSRDSMRLFAVDQNSEAVKLSSLEVGDWYAIAVFDDDDHDQNLFPFANNFGDINFHIIKKFSWNGVHVEQPFHGDWNDMWKQKEEKSKLVFKLDPSKYNRERRSQ